METPTLPANEKTRLETLRSLNLLDTSPEERFDRLTRLAKRMFGVPISLVSLVDEQRQWFKSKQGLEADETPRDISFCGHAILGDDVFMVPDATQDPRFSDNPLVTANPHIKFYAGCPLRVLNGSKLGTLCVIDQQPRVFSSEDLALLKDLAVMAEQELAAVQLATLDELTMISNRRGFTALARHAISISKRKRFPTTLVFLDLNKFKHINDTYGHAEGDRALLAFAEQIKNTFRESDVYARIGGDEFVVLLTDTPTELVSAVLERFNNALNDYNQAARRGYDISYSVGVSQFNEEQHGSIEALLEQADSLMYEDKMRKDQKLQHAS